MYDYLTRADRPASGPGAEESCSALSSYREYLLSQIGRNRKVLDVGCMEGQLSRTMLEQYNEVWGVELNPEAAKVARKVGVKVQVANIEEGLPFEDSFFDVVHAGEVLEHLFDTRNFFDECHRVLKKEGFVVFAVPNLNSLENRLKVLKGGYLSNLGAYPEDHFGCHIRIFNLSKIRELCEQTGFEIEEVRGIFSLQEASMPGLRRGLLPKQRILKASLWAASRFAPGFAKFLLLKIRKLPSV